MTPAPRHVRQFGKTLLMGVLALLLIPRDSASQPKERPADHPTATQLTEGAEKAAAGKWLDAIEQFQRVMDTAGDELTPVGPRRQLPARWVAQDHISRLPPAGLKLYRQRVDGQAATRVAEAKKAPTTAELHKVLAEMFNSAAAEEAILELARRAFAAGHLDEAAHFWKMLLPGAPDDGQLHFPQPQTPAAAVTARLILVHLYQGDRDDAATALDALKKDHPDAGGLLAGKAAKYADTLTEFLNRPDSALPPPAPEPGWNTFAGQAGRDGNTHAALPYFWPDEPAWKIPLPSPKRVRFGESPSNPFHRNALAFHPVIAGPEALIADAKRVWSVDRLTGRPTEVYASATGGDTAVSTLRDVRHTLTVHRGHVYARLGADGLQSPLGEDAVTPKSELVCLGPRAADTPARKVLWRLQPPGIAESTTIWEGCPVVTDGRVYAMFWRQARGETVAGVACYQPGDGAELPLLLWQRIVGKSGGEPNGDVRHRHELLTLAGANILVAPQAGSVTALDGRTGQPAWEFRYESADRATLPRYRDLCPPVASGGKVFLAPADRDHLFCVDAFTGRLIWDRDGVEVQHLLGVARGRLIATFGGQLKGLRGLSVRTGADTGPDGWTLHDQAGEITFGRGLVSDDAVVWPTRHGLAFVSPEDGRPLRQPIPGSFGNLTFADGLLLVATGTELWGYLADGKAVSKKADVENLPPDAMVWTAEGRPIRAAQVRRAEGPQPAAEAEPLIPATDVPAVLEAPLDRKLVSTVNDPTLRLLAESPRLIALGEQLHVGAQAVPNPAKHEVTFAGETPRAIILAGPAGVTAIHPGRLTVMWELLLDATAPRLTAPNRPGFPLASGKESATTFDAFTLIDDALFVVHDAHDLLCYAPATGTLKWGRRVEDLAPRVPFTATWNPHMARSGNLLAVQTSTGAIGVLDADTGTVRHALKTFAKSWIEPPTVVGAGQFAWPTDDAVMLYDADRGAPVATHALPNPVSLSGVPPRLRLHGNDLLVLTDRNAGTDADLLDAATLKRKWVQPPVTLGRRFEDIAVGDDRFFVAADDRLSAYAWKEAEPLWSVPLPPSDGPRRLAVTPAGVWVAPRAPEMTRRNFDALAAFRGAGGDGARLVRAVGDSYNVWTRRTWPVLLVTPMTGAVAQRWNIPALGVAAGLDVGRTRVNILTGQGRWRLEPLAGP